MTPGRRLVIVANGVALAVGLWFAARAGGRIMLGPARTDDLPYGDLLTLSRPGALLWSALAVAGVAAGVSGRLRVAFAAGAAWAGLAVIAFVQVAIDGALFGMSRPGGSAAALALALATGLGLLTPGRTTRS